MMISDISCGKETVAIQVVNDIDDDVPSAFEYTRALVPSLQYPLDDFEVQYVGCHCPSESCSLVKGEHCACIVGKSSGPTYDDDHRLLSEVLVNEIQKPVFECNNQCNCPVDKCPNRTVQLGIKCSLTVFKTQCKGWALRTNRPIRKGSFVCEYAGEILTGRDAKERARKQVPTNMNYIHVLKEHVGGGKVIVTYIDPTYIGNVGRFINHSCEPNLVMIPVRVDNAVPRLALFAKCDVRSGSELSFDYSGSGGENSSELSAKDRQQNCLLKLCFCESETCLKFLPFDPNLF